LSRRGEATDDHLVALGAVVALDDPAILVGAQLHLVHRLEPGRVGNEALDGLLRRRREAVDALPAEGHEALALRGDGPERVHDDGGAGRLGAQEGLQRARQRRGVEDGVVGPDALPLAPPVGLVVAQHEARPLAEELEAVVVVDAEVVGAAEHDAPAALLEDLAVQAHEGEVLGELGRIDDRRHPRRAVVDETRVHRLPQRRDARRQRRARVVEVGMVLPPEQAQHDGLGLTGGCVGVQFGHLQALVGDEDVGAGDAMPQPLRGLEHEGLGRQQRQEGRPLLVVVEQELHGLVDHRREVLAGGEQLTGLRRRQHRRRGREAGRAVEPGVIDEPEVDDAAGEGVEVVGHGGGLRRGGRWRRPRRCQRWRRGRRRRRRA
jgi:hypothetical protein